MSRVLVLDIETSPALAYIWKMWKENIGANQVIENSTILSYAGKFLGEEKVYYDDARDYVDERPLLEGLHNLLSNADAVVAHNGRKFDLKQIRGRMLVNKIPPFAPIKMIDTLEIAKREFGFMSNSLAFLANSIGVQGKGDHRKFPGFILWKECLKGNREAWDEMKEYNIQDIKTLEEVYLALRPWSTQHPNLGVFQDGEQLRCPKCGGNHLHKRGFARTAVAVYQRYQCTTCGGWSRSRQQEAPVVKGLLVNVN